MELLIDNAYITLEPEKETKQALNKMRKAIHESLDPLDPNRFHAAAFRRWHTWDGRAGVCILEEGDMRVPTGLLDELSLVLKKQRIPFTIKDRRGAKVEANADIPENLVLKGEGVKTIEARDYQVRSLRKIFNEQVGLIEASTNAGKSMLFYSIVKFAIDNLEPGEKILFVAPRISIVTQIYNNVKAYLPNVSVGVWGDGRKELNNEVVCATIKSIADGSKKPDIKITSDKDKRLERFATKYYDAVMLKGKPRNNLKLLKNNFRPSKKYEIKDKEEIDSLAFSLDTDKAVTSYFEKYKKRYKALLRKKGAEKIDKYETVIEFLDKVRILVVDEAHHASSSSYQRLFTNIPNARMKIGLTGTMDSKKVVENVQIKSFLGKPLDKVKNQEMIERGFSAKPHIIPINNYEPSDLSEKVELELKFRQVPKSQADLTRYQITYRKGVIENEARNKMISNLVNKILKADDTKAILIITNSIEHGEIIQDELAKLGLDSTFMQGKDSSETRDNVIEEVKQGKRKVLIGTQIFDEGIDIPNFKYFINCAGGKSYKQLLQRIGRILRIQEDKKDVFIFDIVDRQSPVLFKQAQERMHYYKEEKFDIVEKE